MRSSKVRAVLACAGLLAALSGCETIEEEVTEVLGPEFFATLTPGAGGSGSGRAEIALNDVGNVLCTDLDLSSGVNMTAGHITGPGNTTIATIDAPDDNDTDDCNNVTDAIIDGIRANPGAYSVHIDATTGDLSGTLRRES